MIGQCAKCPYQDTDKLCRNPVDGKSPAFCCTKLYADTLSQFDNQYESYMRFSAEASRQEISCYEPSQYNPSIKMPVKPRMVEAIEFCHRMGYQRVGLAFCGGLHREANALSKVLEAFGFEVVSVMCKVGGKDKTCLGLAIDEKINPTAVHESMCNPIGQAVILNNEKTEFNLMLGLCIGHDSLFLKHSDALCTVIAVKDRVTGHNPLAVLYTLNSYYQYLQKPKRHD